MSFVVKPTQPMNSDTSKPWIHPWLTFLIVVSAALITAAFVYYWEIYFDSDVAMIGLIGKSILERGEHPIYVWSVGYQGMLIEGNLVALMFKLFGVGPRVLNFGPALLYGIFLFTFYRVLRPVYGKTQSLLATLLVVVSSPLLYIRLVRTMPNYPEIFLMGTLFFGLYHEFLKRHYIARKPIKNRDLILPLGMGIVAGFGIYTYAQFFFFAGAVGMHAFLLYCRTLSFSNGRELLSLLLAPQRQLPRGAARFTLTWLNRLAQTIACLGMLSFIFSTQEFHVGQRGFRWSALTAAFISVSFCVFFNFATLAWTRRAELRRLAPLGAVSLAGLVLGISPKIYFNWILGLTSSNRMTIGGNPSDVFKRLHLALQGGLGFLNLTPLSPLAIVAGLGIGLSALVFFRHSLTSVADFVCRKSDRTSILSIPPWFFLFWVVLIGFCLSEAPSDIGSARYTLVLLLVFAISTSFAALWALERSKYAVYALFALILLNNAFALSREIQAVKQPFAHLEILDWLKTRQIHYAYADYWYAYTLDFLSQEEIIVEPLYSTFCPYYGPLVKKATRLGLIAPKLDPIPKVGQIFSLHENSFRVLDIGKASGVDVLVVERNL
ncbi:glycosyltransferase family 39 protein [Bdellovibrionota bacterium FG-1]